MIYTDLLSYLHSQDNFQKQYPEEAVYDDMKDILPSVLR